MASSRSLPPWWSCRAKIGVELARPCMMLCPAVPYPVEPSDPRAAGAQIAPVSIHWFRREPTLPDVARPAYDYRDKCDGRSPCMAVTPPPLGSVRVMGSPLWMMTMPASVHGV